MGALLKYFWQLRNLGISALLTGSLWEPRIQGKILDDTTLLVSFNPWMESARYQIHVASFLNDKKCKMITRDFTEVIAFINYIICGNLDKDFFNSC